MLFRFRDFKVCKEACVFRKGIYELAGRFPKKEAFVLTSQILRAVNSILLNIAEGSNRLTNCDFSRFLNISSTSFEEVVVCLDIALNEKHITQKEHEEHLNRAEGLGKKLVSFNKQLRA